LPQGNLIITSVMTTPQKIQLKSLRRLDLPDAGSVDLSREHTRTQGFMLLMMGLIAKRILYPPKGINRW
jgi:hypothetical protein